MQFTNEQFVKAKAAKSVEELLSYAKEIGYPLTEEEAKNYFEQWHKEGELADEELDNVAGGCGEGEVVKVESTTVVHWKNNYDDPATGDCFASPYARISQSHNHSCGLCSYFRPIDETGRLGTCSKGL